MTDHIEFRGVLNDPRTLIQFSTHFYFRKPAGDGTLNQVRPEDRTA